MERGSRVTILSRPEMGEGVVTDTYPEARFFMPGKGTGAPHTRADVKLDSGVGLYNWHLDDLKEV
jgi:hypothetical protein